MLIVEKLKIMLHAMVIDIVHSLDEKFNQVKNWSRGPRVHINKIEIN